MPTFLQINSVANSGSTGHIAEDIGRLANNERGCISYDIIYDDIIYSLQQSGGVSVYWKMLEDFIPVHERFVYNGKEKNIFYIKREKELMSHKNILLERYKNITLNHLDPFIFHSSYYRYCKNKNAVNITTVHDFTYELFRFDIKSVLHKLQKKNTVMHSDGVICISENTKKDLFRYYPNYKGKIAVIYHGFDAKTYNYKQNVNRTHNVLFVGARTKYKGFDFTLQLLSKLPMFNLKIVGGGQITKKENDLLEHYIPNRYEHLGFVPDDQLAKLYNESFALFYPSEYEGFGFPVIEAQACGCPIICQRKSSIPEVSGDKCIYVDSSDIVKSVEEIRKLFIKDFYTKIQSEGLENVKRFSWEKCVKQTLHFYEECFNNKIIKN